MRTVLVVDDDRDLREMVAFALGLHGFGIESSSGGQEALARLRDGPAPDVVLLDMMMPDMDGAEFLAAMRADARLSALPVVILTGDPNAPARLKPFVLQGYLRKPVELAELVGAIERAAGAGPAAEPSP